MGGEEQVRDTKYGFTGGAVRGTISPEEIERAAKQSEVKTLISKAETLIDLLEVLLGGHITYTENPEGSES